jgi:hypothetical protein
VCLQAKAHTPIFWILGGPKCLFPTYEISSPARGRIWAELTQRRRRRQFASPAPQSPIKGKGGGRACCMTGRDNVPANACPDNLPLKSGASTAGGDVPTFLDDLHGADLRRDTFKLPGAGASTVYVSALMNSMPRWLLKSNGKLRSFVQSILDVPRSLKRASSSPSCSAVWPMPIPYPETFSSSSLLKVEKLYLKRLVSIQVVCMSWPALECPPAAP